MWMWKEAYRLFEILDLFHTSVNTQKKKDFGSFGLVELLHFSFRLKQSSEIVLESYVLFCT